MQKKRKIVKNKLFVGLTLLFVLSLTLVFLFTANIIREKAEAECYDRIESASERAAAVFCQHMDSREAQLDMVAGAVSNIRDLTALQILLDDYGRTCLFDTLALRLSDGTLLVGGDALSPTEKLPAFAQDQRKAAYVSSRIDVTATDGDSVEYTKQFIYHAVPVRSGNVTVAMLYGYTDLNLLPAFIHMDGADMTLHVVDSVSGDFLMDTGEGTLGNLYAMDAQDVKGDRSFKDMQEAVAAGDTGDIVFCAPDSDRYLYTYYRPVGIEKWSLQITMDEETAFAEATNTNYMLGIIAATVMLLNLFYILSMLLQQRSITRQSRRMEAQRAFVYDVEHLLFNAYHESASLNKALELVGQTLGADTVMLFEFGDGAVRHMYHYELTSMHIEADFCEKSMSEEMPGLYDYLVEHGGALYDPENDSHALSDAEYALLHQRGVRSMMIASVADERSRQLRVALCAVNLKKKWRDHAILSAVVNSFLMAIHGIRSYNLVRDMGIIDCLTGLKSRNCYEQDIKAYKTAVCDSMHCVFIDANGLHEINNRYGHKAGDRFLCVVADEIKESFGTGSTYRVGGDEFVIFVANKTDDYVRSKMLVLQKRLAEEDCHVSVGHASHHGEQPDIVSLTAAAESAMYADKKQFYLTAEGGRTVRFSHNLGEMLQSERKTDMLP